MATPAFNPNIDLAPRCVKPPHPAAAAKNRRRFQVSGFSVQAWPGTQGARGHDVVRAYLVVSARRWSGTASTQPAKVAGSESAPEEADRRGARGDGTTRPTGGRSFWPSRTPESRSRRLTSLTFLSTFDLANILVGKELCADSRPKTALEPTFAYKTEP